LLTARPTAQESALVVRWLKSVENRKLAWIKPMAESDGWPFGLQLGVAMTRYLHVL